MAGPAALLAGALVVFLGAFPVAAADASLCPPLRKSPPLYDPPAPFATDFRDRQQALNFFSEGWGAVTTAGSLACRRTDHLRYDQPFDGYGVDTDGRRGLRILMDSANASSCHRDSQYATGHLLTKIYLTGGRIEMRARIGFGVAPPAYASEDSFSCLGLYVHDSVSVHGYRNEISMCVSSADTSTVRLGYWVGDDDDKVTLKGVDLAQSFNLYAIEWSSTRVAFLVNDAVIWEIAGQSMCAGDRWKEVDLVTTRLPFEPMSVRIILRPRGQEYHADTLMDVASFAYTPWLVGTPPVAATASAQADAGISSGASSGRLTRSRMSLRAGAVVLLAGAVATYALGVVAI